jgi:hypothetical protein
LLPAGVDTNNVQAHYEDGLLEVRVPWFYTYFIDRKSWISKEDYSNCISMLGCFGSNKHLRYLISIIHSRSNKIITIAI